MLSGSRDTDEPNPSDSPIPRNDASSGRANEPPELPTTVQYISDGMFGHTELCATCNCLRV